MNKTVSRRVGAVMSLLRPLITEDQYWQAVRACEDASSFSDLPAWLRTAVRKAETDQRLPRRKTLEERIAALTRDFSN